MHGISLIFPHLDTPQNTAILELKKQMLKENTAFEYQLLYVTGTTTNDVYPAWNWLASRAKYNLILWDNSDIVYAKDWDVLIHQAIQYYDWLSLRLIECGQIGVHQNNIEENFGITSESFKREQFENFVQKEKENHPDWEDGWVWYSPSVFRKHWFLQTGGFPTDKPFPHPNDAQWKNTLPESTRFGIVNSYAYHFQMAGENRGEKPPRI